MSTLRTDIHQHLLPLGLLSLLQGRDTPPLYRDGEMTPLLGNPYSVKLEEHDPAQRSAQARSEGIERVLLSLSPALGVEHLTSAQAAPLLQAWHEGAEALGDPFGYWVSYSVREPDLDRLAEQLRRPGAVGVQVPADQLTLATIGRTAEVLRVAQDLDRPVLVHPGLVHPGLVQADLLGPGSLQPDRSTTASQDHQPVWWTPLVDYVAQLHTAWHTWHAVGRARHPRLRICFVALAGLAPLHHERLRARGGTPDADPGIFYDTSSYGPDALRPLTRIVGVERVVHGSDRPNAEPTTEYGSPALTRAIQEQNVRALLGTSHPAIQEPTVQEPTVQEPHRGGER